MNWGAVSSCKYCFPLFVHLVPSCGFSRALLQEFSLFNPTSLISPCLLDYSHEHTNIFLFIHLKKQIANKSNKTFLTSYFFQLTHWSALYFLSLVPFTPFSFIFTPTSSVLFIGYQHCLVKFNNDIYIVKFNWSLSLPSNTFLTWLQVIKES